MGRKVKDDYQKNPAIPQRIAACREELGMSQMDLIDSIRNYFLSNEEYANVKLPALNASIVSSWETAKRPMPKKYIKPLASIFGVTEDYLRGFTSDRYTETNKNSEKPEKIELSKTLIPAENLFLYDGEPIYVMFKNYQHKSGWALFDYKRKRFIFCNGIIQMNSVLLKSCVLYAVEPFYLRKPHIRSQFPMNIKEVKKADMVYVYMCSSDPIVQAEYNGWYHHNETHTGLINGDGNVLPYTGLHISYNAFLQPFSDS